MNAGREPGSPFLLTAEPDEFALPETFADADALARRIHSLRGKSGLDVTVGSCANGSAVYPGVLVWLTPRTADAGPRYLAFAAGPGVDTPALLLAALGRTRVAVAA